MKKSLLFSILTIATTSAFAQFRIQADGNIAINTNGSAVSPLSMNYEGNPYYYMSFKGNRNGFYAVNLDGKDEYNWGIGSSISSRVTSQSLSFNVGLLTTSFPYDNQPQTYGRSFGLFSIAGNFTSGYNYSVFGLLKGTNNGAAIYGTSTETDYGQYIDGRYAGYFNGDVKITGSVSLSGSLRGTMLTPSYSPENSKLEYKQVKSISETKKSISARVAELDAVSFYKDDNAEKLRLPSSTKGDTTTYTPQKSFISKQAESKMHYGLIANQLEKAFPDLVYEQEDGTKAINYIEMIPLLVQTINDLNSRIATLENDGNILPRRSATLDIEDTGIISKASLMQNTPNPFSSQTQIRFTLPDDTKNAYIYIFDMTGKMKKQIPINSAMESVTINGYELPAGIYLYSLVVNGQEIDTKRMILSK